MTFLEAKDILSVFSLSLSSKLSDSDDSGFSVREIRQNKDNFLPSRHVKFIYSPYENSFLMIIGTFREL